MKDEHTHVELAKDDEGELAECVVTQCKQPDSLLQERGEGICPLEADHDQVGLVELCEVEGASPVDECTPSLGVMEAPGTLVVTRFPIVNVPVCVFTSVAKCVLQRMHSVSERRCVKETACVSEMARMSETPSVSEKVCVTETPCVEETPCMNETPCVDETPCVKVTACVREKVCVDETPCVGARVCVSEVRCVKGTACVRWRYEREMTVGMREHATACPSVMTWCVSVVARGSAFMKWRRRRHRTRDKGRVAAAADLGTAPGLHGSEREVHAVLGTRPPRARLRR